MKKIGIPLSTSKTQHYINQAYVTYVVNAGFAPVLIPCEDGLQSSIYMNNVDGLLLPGGIDLDTIYYGEDNYSSYSVEPEKDAFERDLFRTALGFGVPIFGICRGFQLIAREFIAQTEGVGQFMDFTTHISGHNQVNDQQLARDTAQHFVTCIPEVLYDQSHLPHRKGEPVRMPVNSMHHQGLLVDFRKKGVIGIGGFNMCAWSTRGVKTDPKIKDSYPLLCEAFTIKGWASPILAVQWHPEELNDIALIKNFFGPAAEELSA